MNQYRHTLLIVMLIMIFTFSCQELTITAKMGKEDASASMRNTLLWQQTSAETRAMYYQTFYLARLQLLNKLAHYTDTKIPAIVLDIDETVLDNSPYEVMLYRENEEYPFMWREWIDTASATAIPGIPEFLHFADSLNVDIFYITNRKEIGKTATLSNLQSLGLPDATHEHLFMRTEESDKTARRNQVSKTHHILLLFGDNLGDFDEHFQDLSVENRIAMVDKQQNLFGTRFIVLPNAMYGEWLNMIFDQDIDAEKAKRKALQVMRVYDQPNEQKK